MAIYNGNKSTKSIFVGNKPVRAVYAGSKKIWPNVVRVEQGADYGEWIYNDHGTGSRSRTVTPWEQDIYSDGSVGGRRMGTPYTQEEAATPTVMWDGATYWNGSCGTDYYYVDYQKVRTRYAYSDGVVRYSGYWNGTSRSRRIDGECGWVRSTVVVSDWTNTGVLCNANAQAGYDCDGTYRVQYYQQKRTLEDRYPDGSGGINRRDEYRAGSLASRQQVNGCCGYVSKIIHNQLSGVDIDYDFYEIPNTEWLSDDAEVYYNLQGLFDYDDSGDSFKLSFGMSQRITEGGTIIADGEYTHYRAEISISYSDNCNYSLTDDFIHIYVRDKSYDATFEAEIHLIPDEGNECIIGIIYAWDGEY